MKRRVLQIIVLLVLGAIVNVAVAWGCTWRAARSNQAEMAICSLETVLATQTRRKKTLFEPTAEGRYLVTHYNLSPAESATNAFRTLGFEYVHTARPDGKSVVVASGMPLASLTRTWQPWEFDFTNLPSGVAKPIWPGFAINTIFYAAMLWVVFFVPGMVKRRVRRRRGLCPACAYPIGTSEVCTECGEGLPLPREGEGRGEGA